MTGVDAMTIAIARFLWNVLGAFIAASMCIGALCNMFAWIGIIERMEFGLGAITFAYASAAVFWVILILHTRKKA